MIYFIKKTVSNENKVDLLSKFYKTIENCTSDINSGKAIVPDYIISSDMYVYDIAYKDSTILIVREKDFKTVADIVINGLNSLSKTDSFVMNTIRSIHNDKIIVASCDKRSIGYSEITKMIDDCRDSCINACSNGIAPNKKITLEFLGLKTKLGLNIQNHASI